jgi:hypothetical protein
MKGQQQKLHKCDLVVNTNSQKAQQVIKGENRNKDGRLYHKMYQANKPLMAETLHHGHIIMYNVAYWVIQVNSVTMVTMGQS